MKRWVCIGVVVKTSGWIPSFKKLLGNDFGGSQRWFLSAFLLFVVFYSTDSRANGGYHSS